MKKKQGPRRIGTKTQPELPNTVWERPKHIPRRQRLGMELQTQTRHVVSLYRSGLSEEEIAERTGLSCQQVAIRWFQYHAAIARFGKYILPQFLWVRRYHDMPIREEKDDDGEPA